MVSQIKPHVAERAKQEATGHTEAIKECVLRSQRRAQLKGVISALVNKEQALEAQKSGNCGLFREMAFPSATCVTEGQTSRSEPLFPAGLGIHRALPILPRTLTCTSPCTAPLLGREVHRVILHYRKKNSGGAEYTNHFLRITQKMEPQIPTTPQTNLFS